MDKNKDLGKGNINKLLIAFAVPCVISMLINSIYNIVDQIFIGQGVGTLGNAATNVIFPLIIFFNALAGLIGNGTAANLSLKLGEGKKDEAQKCVGSAISVLSIIAIFVSIVAYIALPQLVMAFGCTENVYQYAIDYGQIIILGAPFMIIYSGLSNFIRADGSPEYSMKMLISGAIINLILDPIMIFGFNLGVQGGAAATVIGQVFSFIVAIAYLRKTKTIKLAFKDFKPNTTIFRVMALGLSSFITQLTILVLFVFMNNMLTKLGALTEFGADIPLSVYGVISKINSLFISFVLGISIGAQPIIGFNYGAGNYERVKETLKKVLRLNFIIAFIFNICFFLFPRQIVSLFITSSDNNYELFMKFAELLCRSFMAIITVNALEMTTSIVVQSLGKVFKSTMVSFIRQIILFIPIALLLSYTFNLGIYGTLYAGPIADFLCFVICIFVFRSEYKKLGKYKNSEPTNVAAESKKEYKGKHIVVTISREYGSGGRYVGKMLADKLGINFYDKELISLTAKESGLSNEYVSQNEQKEVSSFENSNEDRIFIAEEKVINDLSKESCVIVGRCADFILKDNKDTVKVFLYTDEKNKVERAIKYYGLDASNALKEVNKINKQREKHYNYYTGRKWLDYSNYDLAINVDNLGIEKTVDVILEIVKSR